MVISAELGDAHADSVKPIWQKIGFYQKIRANLGNRRILQFGRPTCGKAKNKFKDPKIPKTYPRRPSRFARTCEIA